MTDMRATERLLEVIREKITWLYGDEPADPVWDEQNDRDRALAEISTAIDELRRRGDTLVRRDDLVRIIEKDDLRQAIEHHRYYDDEATEYAADIAAYDRLENAIGGKP